MSAPTAGMVLAQLALRKRQSEIAAIASLAPTERSMVISALELVSPRRRIDVPTLIATIRRDVARRAEAEAERLRTDANPWKYELHLMSHNQLIIFRDELKRRGEIGAALSAARQLRAPSADQTPARPKVKRRRLSDVLPAQAPADAPNAEPAPERARAPRARSARPVTPPTRYFGPRAFGPDGEDLVPEFAEPFRPPWLLPDADADVQPDVEPDEEFAEEAEAA